jgi:hypothetical protein
MDRGRGPSIWGMCRPVGAKPCPYDGLGCVSEKCSGHYHAKDWTEMKCVKREQAERRSVTAPEGTA